MAAPPAPSRPTLPEIGDTVGGLYRITSLLGEGSFGKVYTAERVDVPEHRVALKVAPLDAFPGKNVARELLMLAAAGHPNVVQLKDHGITRDYLWLTMPVYRGRTLEERLDDGPLSPREAWAIFQPIARGLAALHAAGLRHQDVKPENIFLAEFGGDSHPILLDLGVAAEKNADFCAGTVLYASPEQLLAFSSRVAPLPLTEKMDVYAFAATLLRALVGPAHFPGEGARSQAEIAAAHEARATRPIQLAALPALRGTARAMISAELARWLAPHPAERPSMDEVATKLDVLLEPDREADRLRDERLAAEKRSRETSVRRARLAAVLVVMAGAGAAGVAYAHRATLRLASELARAERRGAESFDKLETCDAAHRIVQRQKNACELARAQDKASFERDLEASSERGRENGAETTSALTRMQSRFERRLERCEREAAEARGAREALQASIEDERKTARLRESDLMASRDAQRALAEERGTLLAAREGELAECRASAARMPVETAPHGSLGPKPTEPKSAAPPSSTTAKSEAPEHVAQAAATEPSKVDEAETASPGM